MASGQISKPAISMPWAVAVPGFLAGLLSVSQVAAQSVIESALGYTVKVQSTVDFPFGEERKGTRNGAGFLVDRERGWVITNAHVVKASPSKVAVSFKDHRFLPAKKLYIDSHLDLAVLQLDKANIPPEAGEVRLNCGREPAPGTAVVAFGHPWSLDYTATRGIVSGTRAIRGAEFLQTDAALNPGNSGGPLIEESTGIVVGINAAGLAKNETEGMGFAVPAPLACTILNLLKQGIDPAPPRLSVGFATTMRDKELVIAEVSGEWAKQLQTGDRVLSVEGDQSARYASRLIDRLRGRREARLEILRGSEKKEIRLTLPVLRDRLVRRGVFVSGMLIGPTVNPENDASDMYVHFVDDASIAERGRIHEDDIVISIDGKAVTKLQEVQAAFDGKAGKEVELIVKRRRSSDKKYDKIVRTIVVENLQVISSE